MTPPGPGARPTTDPGATAVRHYVAAAGPGSVVSVHLRDPGALVVFPGILAAREPHPMTAGHLLG